MSPVEIVVGGGIVLEPVQINWVESDEPLTRLGHGVEFLHDDLSATEVVAFIDGFDRWYHPGGAAEVTVRILKTCPNASIGQGEWAEIMRSTRESILAILSDKAQMKNFMGNPSGPVHIQVNG